MHTRDKGSGKSLHMLAGALSKLNSILKRLAQVFEMLRVTHYYEPLHVFRQLFFLLCFFFKINLFNIFQKHYQSVKLFGTYI